MTKIDFFKTATLQRAL